MPLDEPGPAPRVIVVTTLSELIAIQGTPVLGPIANTQLSSVTNTESDLFYHAGTRSYYFLTSGRWFRAPGLQGPWQYASETAVLVILDGDPPCVNNPSRPNIQSVFNL